MVSGPASPLIMFSVNVERVANGVEPVCLKLPGVPEKIISLSISGTRTVAGGPLFTTCRISSSACFTLLARSRILYERSRTTAIRKLSGMRAVSTCAAGCASDAERWLIEFNTTLSRVTVVASSLFGWLADGV